MNMMIMIVNLKPVRMFSMALTRILETWFSAISDLFWWSYSLPLSLSLS